jgi:hypothetical protein
MNTFLKNNITLTYTTESQTWVAHERDHLKNNRMQRHKKIVVPRTSDQTVLDHSNSDTCITMVTWGSCVCSWMTVTSSAAWGELSQMTWRMRCSLQTWWLLTVVHYYINSKQRLKVPFNPTLYLCPACERSSGWGSLCTDVISGCCVMRYSSTLLAVTFCC